MKFVLSFNRKTGWYFCKFSLFPCINRAIMWDNYFFGDFISFLSWSARSSHCFYLLEFRFIFIPYVTRMLFTYSVLATNFNIGDTQRKWRTLSLSYGFFCACFRSLFFLFVLGTLPVQWQTATNYIQKPFGIWFLVQSHHPLSLSSFGYGQWSHDVNRTVCCTIYKIYIRENVGYRAISL